MNLAATCRGRFAHTLKSCAEVMEMTRKSLRIAAIFAAVLLFNGLLLLAGPVALVKGTVVMNDFPLSGAEVSWYPYFGEDCPVTGGITDERGHFEGFPEPGCQSTSRAAGERTR